MAYQYLHIDYAGYSAYASDYSLSLIHIYREINLSVNAVNKFSDTYDTEVYALIAPTSAGIYGDELKDYFPQINQKSLIADIYNKLNEDIGVIDIWDSMYTERDKYLYYRTDHHWTSEGAFTAYKYAAKKMGITSFEDYDIILSLIHI